MALLEMINAVRGKLREERIASISTTDLLTTEIIGLINDAGSEILEGNDWEFDVRHDGMIWFPSSQTGTVATFTNTSIVENATTLSVLYSNDNASGEIFEDTDAIDLAGYRCSGNRLRARIIFGDSPKGNTSWILTNVDKAALGFLLTVGTRFRMPITTAPVWKTYANEYVLPTNVKDVLSIRNEEEPVALEFSNREIDFDNHIPRSTDTFGSLPEIAIVGGTITSTARTSVASSWINISDAEAVTGPGLMIWPIPDADVHLQYSYRVQHADLAAATDEWDGVPANILHAIEWKAFQFALESGIQNDPDTARQVEAKVARRINSAMGKQSRQPNRRRVPRTFAGYGYRNPRRRWASQTISAT